MTWELVFQFICFHSSIVIFWIFKCSFEKLILTCNLENTFYVNSDNTGDMPTDTATSGIGAVAGKCVGMQFFIVFTIAYFYY